MGFLRDGVWNTNWYDTRSTGGRFERSTTAYRNWITPDGRPGPSGEGGFAAESGRYHLYVSLACPWAHRTLIYRQLKGLNDHISVDVVHPFMGDDGWSFDTDYAGATGDTLLGKRFLREVYLAADPKASGRVTVPVLWDKQRNTIVSNESAEIIRMFNSAFDGITGNRRSFLPNDQIAEIDAVNARIYDGLNNGVYRSGFARKQAAYNKAVNGLFSALDRVEAILGESRYLCGDRLTEADIRLFTTLIRFDAVYVTHFKCNIRRIIDYPNLWAYTREIYQMPGIAETVNMEHIKRHYFESHRSINPLGIVPLGPDLDFDVPHGRGG